jgi:DNA-binding transcriptional LysR family regulator
VAGAPTSGLGLALQGAADAAGFAPRVAHRVDGTQNICQLAATEAASAVVARMAVLPQLESLIVPGLELGVRTISTVVREGRRRDPALRRVIRELHDIAGDSWPEPFGVAV